MLGKAKSKLPCPVSTEAIPKNTNDSKVFGSLRAFTIRDSQIASSEMPFNVGSNKRDCFSLPEKEIGKAGLLPHTRRGEQ
jgi:hypothetical protein